MHTYVIQMSGSFHIIVQSKIYYPNYILDSIHNFLKEYFKSIMLIKPDRLQSVIKTERWNLVSSSVTAKERSDKTWTALKTKTKQSLYKTSKLYVP